MWPCWPSTQSLSASCSRVQESEVCTTASGLTCFYSLLSGRYRLSRVVVGRELLRYCWRSKEQRSLFPGEETNNSNKPTHVSELWALISSAPNAKTRGERRPYSQHMCPNQASPGSVRVASLILVPPNPNASNPDVLDASKVPKVENTSPVLVWWLSNKTQVH